MSLARIVFMKRKLTRKFGVVGKVAGRYIEAGYSVHIGFPTPLGELDIVAKKGGTTLAITVINGSVTVDASKVEEAAKKARSINAKPVVVLYGSGPRLSDEAKKRAEEEGVVIRRVR